MRLLHVINDLNIGGAQKLVEDLILIQKKDPQIEVKCFVFKRTGSPIEQNLIENGINIIYPDAPQFSMTTFKLLRSLLKQADVAHVHLFPSNYITVIVGSYLSGTKLIFTEHSTHNRRRDHKLLRPVEQLVYRRYNQIACISQATADNLRNWIGDKASNNRLAIINNGVATEKYASAICGDIKVLFGREGIPILMVSRLSAAKDHPTVIKALKHIQNPNVFVVFAGDGERRKELEQLVKDNEVENRVIFLGSREDIPQLIKTAFIGVQASNWEGFGLTAVEIMAAGTPLIASDVTGLKEIVADSALVFPKNDDKALAECITSLLNDQNLYQQLRDKGYERARHYSIESTAERYRNLYFN